MTNEKVSIVLVGAGGYGQTYLKELLYGNNEQIRLAGVVDISPESSKYYNDLMERKIAIYHSLEDFYQEHTAELAIISTPIHLHAEHSCVAMLNGSNVLCEKPIAADDQHIKKMKETSDETGKFLAVGFDWSFAPPVQALKQDILAGAFGKAKRLKSLTLGPRSKDYYNRSAWAGKKYSANGDLIYDSAANNAFAHYLHHLLYLTGESIDTSAEISQLTAELYKANEIETFDTCAVRMTTTSNVEICYYASHAVDQVKQPQYLLEFEDATITYHQDQDPSTITAKWHDGRTKTYNDLNRYQMAKIDVCLQAIVRGDDAILCGIEATTPHVDSIHAMHRSVEQPHVFPEEMIKYDEEANLLFVEGLSDSLMKCYQDWCLPSDLAIEWSKRGNEVKL